MGMKYYLYYQMASVINHHCTWIEARNIMQRRSYLLTVSDGLRSVYCRMITLYVCRKRYHYRKGRMWHISEYDIDKAVIKLRQENADFRRRLKHEMLLPMDIENIICMASFGIIHLELQPQIIKCKKQ